MHSIELYNAFDLKHPVVSPRTELYPLQLIGSGTPLVESLTGYIARLAQQHDVSTFTLITDFLGRRFLRIQNLDTVNRKRWKHFLGTAVSLNGTADRIDTWIAALESATGTTMLRYSTMISWKTFFAHRGLLRTTRAWCPRCYHDWHASHRPVYEPLLWALADVSVCPIHRRRLIEQCPHCRRRPSMLTPRSRPGCCPHCHLWLGRNHEDEPDAAEGSADIAQALSGWIGKLLAITPQLDQPSNDVMWANLKACVQDLAGGNLTLFTRAAGMGVAATVFWLQGRKRPSLNSISRVCTRFGIPLFRFLTEMLSSGDPDWEHARQIVLAHQTRPRPAFIISQNRPHQSLSNEQINSALLAALREQPLPTISQIAARIGVLPTTIYDRFPDFPEAIAAVRNAQLEAALTVALRQPLPPTVREFEKQHNTTRGTLRDRFPGLYQQLLQSSSQRRFRRREETRKLLQAACVEEPPPSGYKVAARAGSGRVNLKRVFPDLWERIIQRFARYQRQEILRKRAAFSERVHQIATALLLDGKYPSRRRILPLMAGTELRLEHMIVSEAKRAVLAFEK